MHSPLTTITSVLAALIILAFAVMVGGVRRQVIVHGEKSYEWK